jgi:hypothetical protein
MDRMKAMGGGRPLPQADQGAAPSLPPSLTGGVPKSLPTLPGLGAPAPRPGGLPGLGAGSSFNPFKKP